MKKLFMFLTLLISTTATARYIYETGKVVKIPPEGRSVISIFLDGSDNVSKCSGGSRWTFCLDDPLYREKFSLLLTAATTGKTVRLMHLEHGQCGGWNSNKIYYVEVNF